MQKTGKLELTWVGKYDNKIVEPRILVEDKSKSYGDPNSKNMLIHGDNLIALQALMQDYAGKIKCIYIDPPYNTGVAFEHYDDNVEHSIWLSLMRARLEILHNLLTEDGVICVQIDSVEMAYLKILLDEIFLRQNFVNVISVKTKVAGVSGSNMGRSLQDNVEYILVYAKDKNLLQINPVYVKQKLFSRIKEYEEEGKSWKYTSVLSKLGGKTLLKEDDRRGMKFYGYSEMETMSISAFAHKNNIEESEVYNKYADRIFQTTNAQSSVRQTVITETEEFSQYPMFGLEYIPTKGKNEGNEIEILYKGDQRRMMMFLSDAVEKGTDGYYYKQKVNTLWNDFQYNNLTKEGGVQFPNGKKPEALVERVIELFSSEGDIILDSFLGSGTTAATAHKLKRTWIGIELGQHCYSHCIPRLKAVIDSQDRGGITELVNWQGGGGYHFYELAPSLLVQNEKLKNVYQINPEYTFEMLCEAICKIEGFKYRCDGVFHGNSSEDRFIHITKDYVNAEYIKSISETLREGQSLLVYGLKIQSDIVLPDNIEVKKIPKDLLKKCDFESEVR